MRRGLLAALLILLILGGGGYWYWTTTPVYSILQAREAVKNHDVQSFNKYVDVESIASNLVDVILAKPVGALDLFGSAGRMLGFGLVSIVKPRALEVVKEQINELVEQGGLKSKTPQQTGLNPSQARAIPAADSTALCDDEDRVNGISVKGVLRHYGFAGKCFSGIKYTNIEGKMAHVGLSLHNQKFNQDMVLDLRLHDMGGYWRIDQLSNLPDLAGTLIRLESEYRQHRLAPAA